MGASWLHVLSLFAAVGGRIAEQRESFHKNRLRYPPSEMMAHGLTNHDEG